MKNLKNIYVNKIWLKFNLENDRRNLLLKRVLIKNFYDDYSGLNKYVIKPYLYRNGEIISNKCLFEIFQSLISLYLKCHLSFIIIEAKCCESNSNFEPKKIID